MSSEEYQVLLTEIKGIRTIVDELVEDTRRVRPMLDKYLSKPWLPGGKKIKK